MFNKFKLASGYSDTSVVRKLNSILNLLIAFVVIVFAGAFFYLKEKPPVDSNGVKLSTIEVDKVVNKYMQQTSVEALRQKILSDRAVEQARKKIVELNEQNRLRQQKELENIPADRQIWKEADVQAMQVPQPRPAPQPASNGEMTESEKREYARQYIENARRGGYAIELNENMEVIKWTPLRKPSQQDDSFESNQSD
jgi:hypothetical protein